MVSRCPGEGQCTRWDNQAGTYEDKVNATIGCEKCNGNPPLAETGDGSQETGDGSDIDELVDEIEDIIEWEDGGHPTDWSCYGYAHKRLVTVWRKAERLIERRQQARLQTFLLGWLKQPPE